MSIRPLSQIFKGLTRQKKLLPLYDEKTLDYLAIVMHSTPAVHFIIPGARSKYGNNRVYSEEVQTGVAEKKWNGYNAYEQTVE